ncbi:MAG TPA: hypothetical protein VMW42_13655 [Desulfatiglandales bacterium]|nr:hypothetical protein [Desulfatiglandales bacterium]
MKIWSVAVTRYKGQIKVGIPKELALLSGIHRCEYVEMSLGRSGQIIMEAFDERGKRKVQGKRDKFRLD